MRRAKDPGAARRPCITTLNRPDSTGYTIPTPRQEAGVPPWSRGPRVSDPQVRRAAVRQIRHCLVIADDATEQVWTPRPLARAAALVFVAVGVLGALSGVVSAVVLAAQARAGDAATGIDVAMLCAPLAVAGWRLGLHPLIATGPEGVTIRNPVATTFVPWSDIQRCTPGYSGITIVRRDGSRVVAWAVQKSNAARWLNRRVRADDVADHLESRSRR